MMKSRREPVRWGGRGRGRRRPRRFIVGRARVTIVWLLVLYAAVAAAVIHGRNWRPARPCANGPCACGRACADSGEPNDNRRSETDPGEPRNIR